MGSNTGSNGYLNTISKYATELSIISIIAIFFFGLVIPEGWSWFLVIGFMGLFVVCIGLLRTGRLDGIFINERNLWSLSRFQLVLWTIIVLSAFLTIALIRISASIADPEVIPDPLRIEVPQRLWTLLGISTASLVGSPLILSTKVPKIPDPPEQKAFLTQKVAKFDDKNAKKIAENLVATRGKEITDDKFEKEILFNTTIPTERNSLENKIPTLKSKLQDLGDDKQKMEDTLQTHYTENKDLNNQLKKLEEDKKNLENDIQKMVERNIVKGRRKKRSDLRGIEKKIAEKNNELEENKQNIETTSKDLRKKHDEIEDKELELKNAQSSLLKLENTVVGVKKIRKGAETSGTLNFNVDIKDAKFSDMFQGDEKANCKHIDMAKVQMFFFTLIIAFSYLVLLVNLILNSKAEDLSSFPALSEGLVALLGISTGGYLGNKTGDKTKTVPKP